MKQPVKLFMLFLLPACLTSCGQNQTNVSKDNIESETKDIATPPVSDEKDIYTKYEYTDSSGKRLIIQNGFPKGGTQYTDPSGNVGGYAVFWTRIINETNNPLELKIDFPVNSFEISNFPGKYFTILVPADTMTLDKFPLPNYGLTDIASFLDNNIHKPAEFKRTIHPKESSGLYFIMLILTQEATGMTRTGLSLKGKDLFYKISRYSKTELIDEKEIHCGSINLNLKALK